MRSMKEPEIAKALRGERRPTPPRDLEQRLLDEIPEPVPVSRRWLARALVAAALVAGVGAAWLASRPEPDPATRMVADAPTPRRIEDASTPSAAPESPAPSVAPAPERTAEPTPPTVAEPPVSPARTTTGTLTMTVIDDTGATLPGVTLNLESDGVPDAWRIRTTNAEGVATVSEVPAGKVRVTAELTGFEPATTDLEVPPGAEVRERLALKLSSVAETVTVTGESPALQSAYSTSTTARSFSVIAGRMSSLGYANPSTGGMREPNDAPYDRVYFDHYGVHPFVDTEDDPLSTFALDVDSGSYTMARRVLGDGHLPDPDSVRVEEFVNFFPYDDEPPADGDFAVRFEAAPSPFAATARTWVLRVGLAGRRVAPEDRKPAVLTFLVDVSGSMDRENRLELVKRSLRRMLDRLREDDRVGLVVFGSNARVLQEPTADRDAVRRALERLRPEGSTHLEDGLVRAYETAVDAFDEAATNRVVLCSDGVANVGATGFESLLARVEEQAERGIELTTLGFGMGNYNDVLMEQLADNGDGRYAYIDGEQEARRLFEHQLAGTLETIARDAKLQIELDPEIVQSYRLLGYENREVDDEDFRNDDVDAGEIGAGHQVTALYEVKLRDGVDARARWATARLRYERPADGEVLESATPMPPSVVSTEWESAPRSLRLAVVAAEFADVLRGSYWSRGTDLGELFVAAQRLQADFPGRTDVAELTSLIGRASELRER